MYRVEYFHLVKRLRDISMDILNLNQEPISSIKRKIQVLKAINKLLKEQHQLLQLRQQILIDQPYSLENGLEELYLENWKVFNRQLSF